MSKAAQGASLVTGAMSTRKRATEQEPVAVVAPVIDPDATTKQTVELREEDFRRLARWRMETAVELGRKSVTVQDTLAGLVALVLSDEVVARRAKTQISRTPEKRRKSRARKPDA